MEETPPGVRPVIWARPARAPRGPQPKVTLGDLAREAVAIADAEGLDALTMRRLGAALGRGTMSVYRQITGRQDLVDLMIDHVLGEIDLVAHPTWRDGLHWYAHALRDLGHRHPWYPELPTGGPHYGPHGIGFTEHVLSLMDGLDLPIDDVLLATGLVSSFAQGFVRQELATGRRLRAEGVTMNEWMHAHGPYVRALIESGAYPRFSRVIIEARQPHLTADQGFAYALERVLDGIAAGLPR